MEPTTPSIIISTLMFLGVLLYFSFVIGGSYVLAKRKTNNPILGTMLGIILSFAPPVALIYLAFLLFKKDLETE